MFRKQNYIVLFILFTFSFVYSKQYYYSSKLLGSIVNGNKTTFRLFAPNAKKVVLNLYKKVDDKVALKYNLTRDENGVWEIDLTKNYEKWYYTYQVFHTEEQIKKDSVVHCVDPYAKAVASYTTYFMPRKAIVFNEKYDWGNDKWMNYKWSDLIIYEMHVRDMTMHSSSNIMKAGTYMGLMEDGKRGGLSYIKELGVNAVELLPSMEFANIEPPYNKELNGVKNTWNPYERNHWGYMTSSFFAPAAYYAENWKELKWNVWMGKDGSQVRKFKDMVKTFHRNGIAVIMDVVFNHLSEYELGNLKQIDKNYYFRLNEDGSFKAESGCGNDLKTENPMVRRLIVESILYWMKEYHIDGFRFDLAKLIDWETCEEIIREAKKVNPNVIIIAEPWGGGYDIKGFSQRGWAAWNDQIRNGIKGQNPHDGLGWIFGKWYGNNNKERIKSYLRGTTLNFKDGIYQFPFHSVNYLESHDDYTLGDFIRIAQKEYDERKVITNVENFVKISENSLKIHKLAAMFLFLSNGMVMIHEGQEFGRSKVIPYHINVDDKDKGKIDHNSYNKDNETNYINYNQVNVNKDLFDFYKNLIKLRKEVEAFRICSDDDIQFIDTNDEFTLVFILRNKDDYYLIGMNANNDKDIEISNYLHEKIVLILSTDQNYKQEVKPIEKIVLSAKSGFIYKISK
ncbi:MAG TPA: alpha-amylase family glycosyl hydrolase [Ignavibacteriales bacterium]|jgi:pullulanase/glycogen debranching enzyme|nr:alpha-amylase family glycosyl hydrolase [Ignavibacteriales bacterium]